MSDALPEGWCYTTLGAFVTLQRGYDLPKSARRKGSVAVVGSGGRTGAHDVAMVEGPGVTIGRAANLGMPQFVEEDYWPLNTTLFVRDFRGNDVRFTYYLFKTLDLAGYNSGSVQPMLNRNYVRDFPIVVPSVPEQRAIASVLRALDDKVDVNDRVKATALELAMRHYQNFARVGEAHAVGEVADVFDGPHATPTKTTEGPWFLSISSLQDGILELADSAHLSEQNFVEWTRRVTPQIGDVLFSYETRLGAAALMPGDVRACLGRRMALLRPRNGEIGSATLVHAYLSEEFQETVARRAIHGATVDRIPLTELPSWPITLPTRNHRDQAESVLGALHRRIESSQRESRVLVELRDTLLPKLMSGELRIGDVERQVEEAT